MFNRNVRAMSNAGNMASHRYSAEVLSQMSNLCLSLPIGQRYHYILGTDKSKQAVLVGFGTGFVVANINLVITCLMQSNAYSS